MSDRRLPLDARDDWLWICDHWTPLRARLRPGGGGALTGLVAGGASSVPIDVGISDLLFEIEECARFYARVLLDEVPAQHGCLGVCHGSLDHRCIDQRCYRDAASVKPDNCPDPQLGVNTSRMPRMLADVARRYGHFVQESADEMLTLAFMDDAHQLRTKVRKALERPAPPTYLGPCASTGHDDAGCAGELYLAEGRTAGTCRECGVAFTLFDRREWLEQQMTARLMTQAELGRALKILGLGVEPSTVWRWVKYDRLVEVVDGLYRLADAVELAQAAKRKRSA